MNDQFKTDEIKENLKSQDTWLRLLFIVIYGAVLWVTSIVLAFVVVLQFLSVLFTRGTQSNLLAFGGSLAEYVRQIVAYLTFNTEDKPFPFGDWPAGSDSAPKTAKKKKSTAKKKPAVDAS
jgi:hypothetical protein